jgi:hypothetical protein
MIGKRTVLATLCLGYLMMTPGISQAIPLSVLFQVPGPTITADDKIFSDFTLLDLDIIGAGRADLTAVDVSPLVDDPLNPGLKFNAPCCVLGTEFGHPDPASVRLQFSFNVRTSSGLPLIKDNSLLINGFIFDSHPNATIEIFEDVLDAAGNKLGDKYAIARPSSELGDPSLFDSAEFTPQSFLHIVKTILIRGPEFNDGAFLTMFEQRFSQVPEPGSLVLAGVLALCGAAVTIRRRST